MSGAPLAASMSAMFSSEWGMKGMVVTVSRGKAQDARQGWIPSLPLLS
jgi:hypothetical protein